ncbi:MAG: polysaccharide pyruvyl transferase family protein [Alphaproteobacteria bacterium]|nr:polysaccharide pyruvyl transferase family protein [Alphaproteobacteria bacterium]
MKKVGIVSCYFQKNYGSQLQALATQMALDKLGIDNETINISGFNKEIKKAKTVYFMKAAIFDGLLLTKLGMFKNVIRRKIDKGDYSRLSAVRSRKFKEFSSKKYRLSEKYQSKKELSQKSINYSSVLVGSDQLWLPANIAGDYYTLNWVAENVNTISYATSFGQSELPKDIVKKANVFLNKIKHIGVREYSGQKLVEKISRRRVPVVCDPTLLFTGEEWLENIDITPKYNEKYILCYFLGNNKEDRYFALRLKKKTGCKIIALVHLDEYVKFDEEYADYKPFDIDPFDFLNLVKNAEYVCTDSFHCTVFSLLFKKVFFTFKRYRKSGKNSTNSRLDTLLGVVSMKNRLFNGNESINESILNVDFSGVDNKLADFRKQSYVYLNKAVNDVENTDL